MHSNIYAHWLRRYVILHSFTNKSRISLIFVVNIPAQQPNQLHRVFIITYFLIV